ncbi:MAG: TrkH family potassium uptake protein, partial [Bacteroidales bacterium]|nr:TrkH family potassium uptake protein [Bacteroidales bacterium]
MRFEVIFKHLAFVLLMNSVLMLVAFFISLYYHETSTSALLYSTLILLIFSIFPLIFYEKTESIQYEESLAIIVFGWLITCIAGMLPYVMWGGEFTLVNAFFESVSGYTTTGSSILNDIEGLPKGLLFW